MIITDNAVVLLRRDMREADRIASVYTRSLGRINVRFPGVNREKGKLKAFSEPLAHSELRLHLRAGSRTACAAGGKLTSVFPRLRADLARTQAALHFCELLHKMTPEQQPNRAKYDLLVAALAELDAGRPVPQALPTAFALRLMHLTGHGLYGRPVLGIDPGLWGALHNAPFAELGGLGNHADVEKCDAVVRRFFAAHFDYPLKTVPQRS